MASYAYGAVDDYGVKYVTQQVKDSLYGEMPFQSSSVAVQYLGSLFGNVKSLLDSGSTSVLALIFQVFNLGVLSIAGVILLYSIVFSVAGVSQDGGAIASGRASAWVFARVVTSFSILLPLPGYQGFSGIQLLVLKMVLAGSSLADMSWQATVDYLVEHGSPTAEGVDRLGSPTVPTGDRLISSVPLSFSGESCDPDDAQRKQGDPAGCYRYTTIDSGKPLKDSPKYLVIINEAIAQSMNILDLCNPCIEEGLVFSDLMITFDAVVKNASRQSSQESRTVIEVNALFERPDMGIRESKKMYEIALVDSRDRPGGVPNAVLLRTDIAKYIKHVSHDLLQLRVKSNEYTEEEVVSIFAKRMREYYLSVERVLKANPNKAAQKKDTDAIKVARREGWVKAAIFWNKIVADVQPDPAMQPGAVVLPNVVYSVDNYKYEVNDYKFKTARLDDVLELNAFAKVVKGAVSFGGRKIANRYELLYDPEKAQAEEAASLQSWVTAGSGPFNQLYARINAPAEPPGASVSVSQFTVKSDIVLNKMQQMSKSAFCQYAYVFAPEEGSGQPKDLKWCADGGGVPQKIDYILFSKQITKAAYLGQKLVGASSTFFKDATQDIYEQVDKAQLWTQGVVAVVQGWQGAIRALVAHYQSKAKKAKSESGEDSDDYKKTASLGDRYGTIGEVGGIIADPLQKIIELVKTISTAIAGMFLPYGNGLAVAYLLVGVLLSAYLPFVPVVIYIFAVLAWLFSAIEAMVAAPIVAVGFANPEGQEMLGKSEQAVILLLGVYLRPILTLIGFLTAIMLADVLVEVFNLLLIGAVPFFVKGVLAIGANSNGTPALVAFYASVSMMIFYAYALMVILEQCYSITYTVPDKVLKWLGGTQDNAGSSISAVLRNASTGLGQQAQSAAQGTASTTSSGLKG